MSDMKKMLLSSRRLPLWKRKPVWGIALVLLLAAAYLMGIIGDRGSKGPQELVVEGPPPVVSASGPVVPEKRAKLSFTGSGRVKRLAVQPGDRVKQGQLLAQLEPSTVQAGAMAGISPAPSLGSSDLYIVAPFDGVVGLVPINEWETVTPGSPVVILGDLSALRVEIEDLSETDVGRLQEGQSAEISFEAFPGKKVAGRVGRISPMNNAKGGGVNYDVVVEFSDRDLPALRWGMTAHVDILVGSGR
ncbi:MAG: efflux RND transporter periplasmic adaptor subunit [Chloroflexota bacterium]